jgi:OmcA/MtrC family decaheme c-type cytochrome
MSGSSAWFKKVAVVVVFLVATVGLTAAVYKDRIFTPFDKEYYLTDEQVAFIRPGFNVEITDYNIAADRTVTLTFTAKDAGGLPLDLNGVYTPGSIRISFLIAYLPEDGYEAQYVDYATRSVTSPITGVTAIQPTSDSGTIEEIEIGTYKYTFGQQLPADYDQDATHTIGFYAERDLSEFDLPNRVANGYVTFVPSGAPVTQVRQVTTDAACAQCHDDLIAHGRRHLVELCVLCHYAGVIDPDTGNSVDFKVMIHKIHRGKNLPSVQAGTPYQIIGYQQSVSDFSDVVFPQDIRNCVTCHVADAAQADAWFLDPTMAACGSCHDNVNFATGANHAGGPYTTNQYCANCHFPQGEFEFDASIKGAHTVPSESNQLKGINIDILDVSNSGPGQTPTVLFSLKNNAGDPIDPASLPFLNLVMAGPTTDYTQTISESATGAVPVGTVQSGVSMMAAGEYTYTFQTPIPEDAEGSFAMGAEAYRNVVLNPGTVDEFTQRETAHNPVFYFAVTDPEPVPRRTVVSTTNCDSCHRDLALHGGIRHDPTDYCQLCHRPNANDASERPADELPAQTIDLRFMVHRIHMGENLTRNFTIYGFHGSVNTFNDVAYPSDQRTCAKCHVDGTYNVPSGGIESVVDEREFFSPIPPNSAACLGCHDTVDAAAHAFTNITSFGESCGACHAENRDFAVAKVHAH